MKRRNFLKSLASMLIAVGVARRLGATSPQMERINPAWLSAAYDAAMVSVWRIVGMGGKLVQCDSSAEVCGAIQFTPAGDVEALAELNRDFNESTLEQKCEWGAMSFRVDPDAPRYAYSTQGGYYPVEKFLTA